jgi:hypothetical protein
MGERKREQMNRIAATAPPFVESASADSFTHKMLRRRAMGGCHGLQIALLLFDGHTHRLADAEEVLLLIWQLVHPLARLSGA